MITVDVIIYYEHVSREWDACVNLAEKLSEAKLTSVILPVHYWKHLGPVLYKPKVVVLPFLYTNENDFHLKFQNIWGRSVSCVNLHSEQLHDETTKKFQMPQDEYAREVIHVSWSEKFGKALIESGVDSHKVFITGSLRIDLLLHDKVKPRQRCQVLILTSFSKTFVSEDYLERLVARPEVDEAKYRDKVRLTRQVRDRFFQDFYELAINNPSIEFVFRPHPYVEISAYSKEFCGINGVVKLPANVRIERTGSVGTAISSASLVCGWYTSTLIDAAIKGKPVCLYEPVSFPAGFKPAFAGLFAGIKSYNGLMRVIEEPATAKAPDVTPYIREVYGIVDGFAADRTASLIKNLATCQPERPAKTYPNFALYFKYLLKLMTIDLFKQLLLHLGILPQLVPFYKGVTEDRLIRFKPETKVRAGGLTNWERSHTSCGYIFRRESM